MPRSSINRIAPAAVRGRPGPRIGVAAGVIATVLWGIVAATDAAAVAPPAPPGCGAPIVTSRENATPVVIMTGPTVSTSTIVVTGAGTRLTDLDLFVDVAHTAGGDLDVTLQSPAGTVATITTDNGLGNNNTLAGTTFDDQADPDGQVPYLANPGLTTDHPYDNDTVATPLVPEETLAAFAGENPNGTWTLTISDDEAGDGGSLRSWRLDVQSIDAVPVQTATQAERTTALDIPTVLSVVTSTIDVTGAGTHLTDLDLFTDIAHVFNADLDITLQSPAGTVATITTDNGSGNDNTFAGTTFDDQADPDGQVPYAPLDFNSGLITDQPYANNTVATPLVPEEALAAFAGENPNGTWTLTISDDTAFDGGTLRSWRLDVTTGSCPAPAPAPTPSPPPPPPPAATPPPPRASPQPPTTAPPSSAPAVAISDMSRAVQSLRAALSRGVLTIVRTPSPGRLRLRLLGTRRRVLGSLSRTVSAAGAVQSRVRLNSAGRRAARRARRLTVTLECSFTTAQGVTVTTTRKIILRR